MTSFSKPAAHVVLLARPAPNRTSPTLTAVGSDEVVDHVPYTEPDLELGDALAAVERLDRTARIEYVAVDPTLVGPASRPFYADLVDGPDVAPAPATTATATTIGRFAPDTMTGAFDRADLIVTSLPPHHSGDHGADLVSLYAAQQLRVGGILVVLTHCDWTTGELTDLTGAIVTAAQNADLLYLQHVVALHTPIRSGHLDLVDTHQDLSDGAALGEARARQLAAVRGLPAPHRRIHSDVLVFAQPHDHQPLHADAVSQRDDLR
ncbi:hypothetical protein [Umezawaea tangerina]|uniref:Uncharacterized protein n=1 Tax=Umezawaea tangerina TaxID=84725 RepID=A0A2T0SNW1_9PSEU|nr:hypothetical protein [Umezawaea tangerina]PRY35104.1 hypothetical protein CLV43_11422 [Umezawaea tangerina]